MKHFLLTIRGKQNAKDLTRVRGFWYRAAVKKFLLLLAAGLLLSGCGTTQTNPGTYRDWEGELDSVEIVQRFHLSAYQRILVLPVDATAVRTAANPKAQKAVDGIIEDSTKHFAEKLQTKLPHRAHIIVSTSAANTDLSHNAGAVIIRSRFVMMDTGSMTGRMFSGGFGGKSKVTMEGEFIDGGSGKILARTSKSNSHGGGAGPYGLFNMDSYSLESNEDEIIESYGEFLKAFYP